MMLLFLSNSSPFQLIRKGSHYDLNMKVLRACPAAQTCHFPTSKAKTFSNWANPGAAKKNSQEQGKTWYIYVVVFFDFNFPPLSFVFILKNMVNLNP